MGKHQIIYTSCRRGINGVNDGQQIYSHNVSFNDSASDNVKSLFAYQVPALAPGVIMSNEIAEKMPQSFIYRRISDKLCAVALNTYLGRDYMGSAGRFGNHLSHVIICDEQELSCYPCEFYGSELLRSRMDFDEVNSPDRPPYLPEPELIRGYRIDIDTVTEFISSENRMDAYKKMLAAMLSYESARKRIVICDSAENIAMWIAALHYSMPLEIALKINFTTYEYDPSLSTSQICGVIAEGTRYSVNNSSTHFTFDFQKNIVPEIATKGDFFDFIDMGMSLSFDSIQDFHEFIRNKLTYREATERYYSAYALYCFFTDGLNNLSLETFKSAVQMLCEFAIDEEKIAFRHKLLSEKDFILNAANDYALEIFKFIMDQYKTMDIATQVYVRTLVTEKAIIAFVSESISEATFIKFYSELEMLCSVNNVIIPYELMNDDNRETLLLSMQNRSEQWKWCFIIDVLCKYVIVQNIPADELSMEYPIGRLIGNIVLTRISNDENNGFSLITQIITKFSTEYRYLFNMALNVESVLFDAPDSQRIVSTFWKYVYQTIAKTQMANRQNIYNFFLSYDRFEQVFDIYKEFIKFANNLEAAKKLFYEQLEIQNMKYLQLFSLMVYDHYYDYLNRQREIDTAHAKSELLELVIQKNIFPTFIDELIDSTLINIPLAALSKDNEKLVDVIFNFRKRSNENISGRLMLFVTGILLNRINSPHDLANAISAIKKMSMAESVSLVGQSTADIDNYITWITKPIFTYSESAQDLILYYGLFGHTRVSSNSFIQICAKEALKESKGDKEYYSIVEFLKFLFNVGGAEERKDVGKIFCKLSKQKLEGLDEVVKVVFADEPLFLIHWGEIQEIAVKTNPLLNNISNFFKRKRD